MSFSKMGYNDPYYKNIERPKIIKQLKKNIEMIENRKLKIRINSANSSRSVKSKSSSNDKKYKQVRQSSEETIKKIETAFNNKRLYNNMKNILNKDIINSDFSHMKDRSQILKSRNSQFVQKEKLHKKDIVEKNYEIFRKLSNLKSQYSSIFSDKIEKNKENYKGKNIRKRKNSQLDETSRNLPQARESYFSFKSPTGESFISFKNKEESTNTLNTNNEDKNSIRMVGVKYKNNGCKSIFSDLENTNKSYFTIRNSSLISDVKEGLNESKKIVFNKEKNNDVENLILPDIIISTKFNKEKSMNLSKNSSNPSNTSTRKNKESPNEIFIGSTRFKNSSEFIFKNADIKLFQNEK